MIGIMDTCRLRWKLSIFLFSHIHLGVGQSLKLNRLSCYKHNFINTLKMMDFEIFIEAIQTYVPVQLKQFHLVFIYFIPFLNSIFTLFQAKSILCVCLCVFVNLLYELVYCYIELSNKDYFLLLTYHLFIFCEGVQLHAAIEHSSKSSRK